VREKSSREFEDSAVAVITQVSSFIKRNALSSFSLRLSRASLGWQIVWVSKGNETPLNRTVSSQVSFKQGDHTRDYEWLLELEEVVEQGLDPPNIAHVKQLMMMAKICDVAQVRRKRSTCISHFVM
jgi:hypothetical protein